MELTTDYLYRFPQNQLGAAGRCRVRLYKSKNGAQTVLLTELNSNLGESIAAAMDRIANDLAVRWELSPKTTRWIEHIPAQDGQPEEFGELKFTWNQGKTVGEPQWRELTGEEVEILTGDTLDAINRPIGEIKATIEWGSRDTTDKLE